MKIYHYTSIKSLALILKSNKIRFTRLDLLDDLKEIEGIPESMKTFLFVSCWTEDDEENISLWSLYTQMKGIRIEFPQKFYPDFNHKEGDYGNWGFTKDTICPLDINELRTDRYFISNPFWLSDGFYTKVIYDKNYKERKKSALLSTENGIEINHIKNLLRYKHPIWQFQNESRFFLFAQSLPPLEMFGGDRLEQMKNFKPMQIYNDFKYIDVNISPEVINNIIVRCYPNCDLGDEILIQSLLERFTKNGKLEFSHLNETYKTK